MITEMTMKHKDDVIKHSICRSKMMIVSQNTGEPYEFTADIDAFIIFDIALLPTDAMTILNIIMRLCNTSATIQFHVKDASTGDEYSIECYDKCRVHDEPPMAEFKLTKIGDITATQNIYSMKYADAEMCYTYIDEYIKWKYPENNSLKLR